MNVKHFLFILILAILSMSVSAIPYNCTGVQISSISATVDPYSGIGETTTLYAYYKDVNNVAINEGYSSNMSLTNTSVRFLYNGSFINMSYDSTNKRWSTSLIGTEYENISTYFEAWSLNYSCINSSNYTLKIREPFYYTFKFYRSTINTGNFTYATDQYVNDFQYVVLQFADYRPQAFRTTNYLNNFGNLFPFYKPINVANDATLSFWAEYQNGQAVVKLYEHQIYSINLLSYKMKGITWSNEFVYPQYSSERYLSTLEKGLDVNKIENITVTAIVSKWEINKVEAFNNLMYWIVVIGVYFLILWAMVSFGNYVNPGAIIGMTLGYFTIMKLLNFVIF